MKLRKRIAIIGLPGSGKSTFAVHLGKIFSIPVYHLDKYQFIANGVKRDREEFLSIHSALCEQDSWIIEGCALKALEIRFARADTVIYFQFSRLLCIYRVFKRLFIYDRSIRDTADRVSKIVSWEMLNYIWNFERDKTESIQALREKYPHVEFLVFRTTNDISRFIKNLTSQ
jgi:adenylate kinase family enzyme